jgi:hypothetical protein
MTEIERLLNEDKYFFKGYASLDEEGYLVYKSLDEKFKPNMEPRKIFL